MKYERRRAKTEAIRFEGGLDSARRVLEWLIARDITNVSYMPEILNDGEVYIREHILVDAYAKGLSYMSHAHVGNWIVFDPENGLLVMTHRAFTESYIEAPDVDAQA